MIAIDDSPETPKPVAPRALTEADAVEIWIARWLRIRRKDLMARFGCDPKRLYEIWWGERFPGARQKAEDEFRRRYPGQIERTGGFGYRRIPRAAAPLPGQQLDLFGS
ncbi:MAG: hypothetical protein ACKVP7_23720 [Hyphomicrobiaceae bacterium]